MYAQLFKNTILNVTQFVVNTNKLYFYKRFPLNGQKQNIKTGYKWVNSDVSKIN